MLDTIITFTFFPFFPLIFLALTVKLDQGEYQPESLQHPHHRAKKQTSLSYFPLYFTFNLDGTRKKTQKQNQEKTHPDKYMKIKLYNLNL